MSAAKDPGSQFAADSDAAYARELTGEQAHVDQVYAELTRAQERAAELAREGMARGKTDRTGDVRDEEMSGLYERDVLVYNAAKRQAALDDQYEGLVFGRLDIDHGENFAPADREVRYIGRLGVRTGDYELLVIDWRAPAAAPFYRATPVEPLGVIRRRVLRSRDTTVIGIEDDLMVPQAPDDITVVGDGALLAALTRTRGHQMRDIVATIQAHQDEAIRAPHTGVTIISGGPGTGKTVVALHRAAYLLYSNRARYERGGILVIGPNAAYTSYIERVLPSLGEDAVALRALGDVVEAVTATRVDSPEVAAIKGDTAITRVLDRLCGAGVPGAPTEFRAFVSGVALVVNESELAQIRTNLTRSAPRNQGTKAARRALAEACWPQVRASLTHSRGQVGKRERGDFLDSFNESIAVDDFMEEWWPQVDPRQALLWLGDTDLTYELAAGTLSQGDAAALAESMREAAELGQWSIADVPLIDHLHERLGEVNQADDDDLDFMENDLQQMRGGERELPSRAPQRLTGDPLDHLLSGHIGELAVYAHVLVDEAQDLSPMQWVMLGRRGPRASWTIVGDAAQASWTDQQAAAAAQDQALRGIERRSFHMDTNYRNAREIFDYARDVILPLVPDADIPKAVRETGHSVREVSWDGGSEQGLLGAARAELDELLTQVSGSVAVIVPARHRERLESLAQVDRARVVVIDPLSTKGLEWDAALVVDPEAITLESPGGARVLYVVLTRAAHRMTVLRPSADAR